MDQWDRFAASQGRQQRALGATATVDVFVQAETYEPGEGYTLAQTAYSGNPIDAEVTVPSDSADRDAGGTTAEADVVLYVSDDAGVPWTEYGDPDEGASEFVVRETGERYRVETVTNDQNGLDVIEGVEL